MARRQLAPSFLSSFLSPRSKLNNRNEGVELNILFLSQRIPYPPNRGDKIRSFHILQHLSKRHSISVACLAQSDKELKYAEDLEQYCASVDVALLNPFSSRVKSLFSILGRGPLTLPYFYSKKLQKIVDNLVANRNFDLIFVYSSSMAQYILKFDNVRKIMDFVDVDSDKWLQYSQHKKFPMSAIYRMEGNRLRGYEATIAEQFDRCLIVSEPEKDLLKSYAPQASISNISNGVDFEYFKPESNDYEPYTLIFTGVMDYYANVDGVLYFCEHILPLIKSEIPQVKFYIVGSSPVKEIRKLEQQEGIVVTGFVEDIRTYLRKAAVCVVPLRIAK